MGIETADLRSALTLAIKARDPIAVAALRTTLAAIANTEAVDVPPPTGRSLSIEQSPIGAGATEAERRVLTPSDVERIVRAEVSDRESAARDYARSGRQDHADRLRAEIGVLNAHLPD